MSQAVFRHFWRLQSRLAVDGAVYAQPLYMSQVLMADGARRNLVIVCTAVNNVYAFDADTFEQQWKVNLGPNDSYDEAMSPVRVIATNDPKAPSLNYVLPIGVP